MPNEENRNDQSEITAAYGRVGAELIRTIGYQDVTSSLLLVQIKIAQPNLSHRLRHFRTDGIVRRTRDRKDKRIYYYCLTAKGLEMLAILKDGNPSRKKNLSLNELIIGSDQSGVEEKQLFF